MELKTDDIWPLIQSAKDGDEAAMTKLITLHKGLVFTIIFRMTNDYDVSQDLTQDTLIKVFLNIRKVKNARHFRAWICVIARNIVRSYFRKVKTRQTVSLEEIKEPVGQSNIEINKKSMIIQKALSKLSESDRMLLTLAYYQGLSLVEVAEVMNTSDKNIKVRLHRARKRLRKELEGYEHELLSA